MTWSGACLRWSRYLLPQEHHFPGDCGRGVTCHLAWAPEQGNSVPLGCNALGTVASGLSLGWVVGRGGPQGAGIMGLGGSWKPRRRRGGRPTVWGWGAAGARPPGEGVGRAQLWSGSWASTPRGEQPRGEGRPGPAPARLQGPRARGLQGGPPATATSTATSMATSTSTATSTGHGHIHGHGARAHVYPCAPSCW